MRLKTRQARLGPSDAMITLGTYTQAVGADRLGETMPQRFFKWQGDFIERTHLLEDQTPGGIGLNHQISFPNTGAARECRICACASFTSAPAILSQVA